MNKKNLSEREKKKRDLLREESGKLGRVWDKEGNLLILNGKIVKK